MAELAWSMLSEDPAEVVAALDTAIAAGATPEELARAVAYAAALRITRFHTQNDHGDWDEVHHAFTAANALHQAARPRLEPELLRGVYHERAARLPRPLPQHPGGATPGAPGLGHRRRPRRPAAVLGPGGTRRRGRDDRVPPPPRRRRPGAAIAALGHALLTEDAEFHWFQTYEAAVRQFHAWPAGSEERALILTGTARFLAAHTPTRRELSQVVRIATRLRRGEALFEDA